MDWSERASTEAGREAADMIENLRDVPNARIEVRNVEGLEGQRNGEKMAVNRRAPLRQ